jgi:hypothetical protein
MAMSLPNASPLPVESRAAFAAHIQPLVQQLALAREFAATRIASRD